MDIQNVVNTSSTVITSGIGTYAVTELVKYINAVPINSGEKAKIRTFVIILSAVFNCTLLWANGSLDQPALTNAIQLIMATLGSALTAHVTYKAVSGPPADSQDGKE